MTVNTLHDRTKQFSVRIVHIYLALPKSEIARILGRQLLRSGTSPGAHCREGYRSRSAAEMISKYETSLQELDETLYWLELLIDSELTTADRVGPLMDEANEIISILVTSVKTIKSRRR